MAIPQGQGRGCLHGEMMPSIPGPQDQVLNVNYKEQSWEDSGTHGSATQAIAPLATCGPLLHEWIQMTYHQQRIQKLGSLFQCLDETDM